ncbi:hypothetical protein KIPB_015780, partial [Kipferlia bialata]
REKERDGDKSVATTAHKVLMDMRPKDKLGVVEAVAAVVRKGKPARAVRAGLGFLSGTKLNRARKETKDNDVVETLVGCYLAALPSLLKSDSASLGV